jgi:hypothetical protein
MAISTQDDHILALCLSLVTPDLRRIHHQLVSHLCWIDLNAGFDWRPSSNTLIGGVFLRFVGSGPLLPCL